MFITFQIYNISNRDRNFLENHPHKIIISFCFIWRINFLTTFAKLLSKVSRLIFSDKIKGLKIKAVVDNSECDVINIKRHPEYPIRMFLATSNPFISGISISKKITSKLLSLWDFNNNYPNWSWIFQNMSVLFKYILKYKVHIL